MVWRSQRRIRPLCESRGPIPLATDLAGVFVGGWIGVCVCVRALAHVRVCVYVYVYVCVFVLPEPFKSCVDNASGLAHMHTYQTQVSARKHTVPSADDDSPVVGGLAGGGQAAPPGAVAGQDKERQVVVLCVEMHAGVDLAVHAYSCIHA